MPDLQSETRFVDDPAIPWEQIDKDVKRKIMTYAPSLMMVKVAFKTGGIGAIHQHVHTQISYIESGAFAVTIADETKTLKAGDVFYIPSNIRHGVVCLEAGMLVDVFTPMREDFVY